MFDVNTKTCFLWSCENTNWILRKKQVIYGMISPKKQIKIIYFALEISVFASYFIKPLVYLMKVDLTCSLNVTDESF